VSEEIERRGGALLSLSLVKKLEFWLLREMPAVMLRIVSPKEGEAR
jgi:hypothetical protein